MIGDASCRVLLQILGYVYPAYLCFKDVDRGKPDRLKLWCMYWVIMAVLTAVQPIADMFLFFVPFYYTAKVALACYLWMNNLEGTKLVYDTYLTPFVHKHEPYVDHKISQVKAVVSEIVSSNVTKCVTYLQGMVVKALTQNMPQSEKDAYLKAERSGEAAPAAGYRSDSFKSASSSSFIRSFSVKDE